ncbi:MAG TPA: acetate--CoA ligase [Solirubrobacteraceae bacterium]|nr:acetate--CoA ligase [Solirubrobacteraceae bacterium]
MTTLPQSERRLRVAPNMPDYDAARASFGWEAARRDLDGLPGGGLNIAHEAVDRHVAAGRGDVVALRWLGRGGERRELTYDDLRAASGRFAGVLRALGVAPRARVFALAGRIPALYVAALGTLKAGAVFCPLFSAFGPEPIRQRLALGDGEVLVTTRALYERKVAGIRDALGGLRHVLIADAAGDPPPGTLDLDALLAAADPDEPVAATRPGDMALLHFTSGTTGRPKGAVHVHEAVVAHHATGRMVLDLHPGDVFWCTADPGWVTGTSYGIIAPLSIGAAMVVDEADFDGERWYATIEREGVTVLYTAPTAVRMLMRLGAEAIADHDLSTLRFVASVGEPLSPEAVVWGRDAWGLPIHDNWWQTETGGIMIANFAATTIRPGSMGRPIPGVEVALVRRDEHGDPVVRDGAAVLVETPGEQGELALRPGWPSMFRGYLHDEERYRRCFRGGWYLTGDLVRRDEDGYLWFVGRGDDVIKSAGHLIGPFEVESALLDHEAVAEAAVYGVPDPVAGELVEAQVVPAPGFEPGDELRRTLLAHARRRLGPAVAPRTIAFAESVPHTRSGKIMRRLVRARRLGLPEGDVSTVERS